MIKRFGSKHLLKGLFGGIISVIIGYLGYIAFYCVYVYMVLPKIEPTKIDAIREYISSTGLIKTLIGSIDWNWFILYTLGFFIIGVLIVFVIDKIRKKK